MLKRIYRVDNAARVAASAYAETARSAWERGCWREACDMLEIVDDGNTMTLSACLMALTLYGNTLTAQISLTTAT